MFFSHLDVAMWPISAAHLSPGDLSVESSVYEWLIDDDNRELQGTIEEVNRAMLKRLIEYNPFVAVVFISKKGYVQQRRIST